jgi:methyl-accepting chemotaxis protein
MKITTRIATGYSLFIAILVALVVYQVFTINSIQAINRSLSGTGFQNAYTCLEALRDRDLVEEYARKTFAMPSNDLKELQESQRAFDARLKEIKAYAKSEEELAEFQRLSQLWDAYVAEQESLLQHPLKNESALPESLQNSLDQLGAQTLSVYRAALGSMSSNVEASRKTGETAALFLYCAVAVAFAFSILVSFLIYRSISKQLASLTEGTRAVAEGKLFYRLDTSSTDELSQIAKDFNSIVRRLKEQEKRKETESTHPSE